MLPRATPFAVLSLLLALASPVKAQSSGQPDRQTAEETLEQVEQLLDDPAPDPHALTPALTDLARQESELDATDRRRAKAILARPSDGTGPGAWSPAAITEAESSCSAHFCFHWVDNDARNDAPDLTDNEPANGRPDYVDLVAASFEQSYATEVGSLGWRAPVSDGTRGGNALVDVYVSDIAPTYGYAVPEGSTRSTYGYLVVDDDYEEFGYSEPTIPAQATAAHEFNHVLQYAYDADQDGWMFESTATWAEDKVFDGADDYVNYLSSWAALPEQPITDDGDGPPTNGPDLKMYGSAIWNHWLDGRYGAQVVRRAWAVSQANSDPGTGFGFAPGAYDRAIKDSCGPGFAFEFEDFTASVAEWQAPNSGIREATSFPPDVDRAADIAVGGSSGGSVDHTAFQLHEVQGAPAGQLYLTGTLGEGTPGSIALVGLKPDGTMIKSLGILNVNGRGWVSLEPGPYDRVTAVMTNADTSHTGFDGDVFDWAWAKDGEPYTLAVSTTAPTEPAAAAPPAITPCQPADPEPPTTTPTPSPSATVSPTPSPTVSPTPTPTPTPATSLRLSRSTTRIGSAIRTGRIALFARSNKGGRLTAASTVDRATARRLRVGRRTTSTGTGRRTLSAPGRFKVNVRLTRKARAALKRHRRRSVRVKVVVTFAPADGTRTVRRALSVLLRP